MFSDQHLNLRSVRLKSAEEWSQKREGLSFLLVKQGAGKLECGSFMRRVSEGDVLVVKGGGLGKLLVENGSEMQLVGFSVTVEQLFPLFGPEEISRLQDLSEVLNRSKVYPASSTVAAKCQRLIADVPRNFDLDHRSQLLRVASVILAEEFKNAAPRRAGFVRLEEHMRHVLEKLPAEELFSLSVGQLAVRFGCSRRHLNRLFHLFFGRSVAALRMEMRLLKAVSLLRDPDMKIIHVAQGCGFTHLGLFNTCFKRRFGVTPSQWRKRPGQVSDMPSHQIPLKSACPLRRHGLCLWDNVPESSGLMADFPVNAPRSESARALDS